MEREVRGGREKQETERLQEGLMGNGAMRGRRLRY